MKTSHISEGVNSDWFIILFSVGIVTHHTTTIHQVVLLAYKLQGHFHCHWSEYTNVQVKYRSLPHPKKLGPSSQIPGIRPGGGGVENLRSTTLGSDGTSESYS